MTKPSAQCLVQSDSPVNAHQPLTVLLVLWLLLLLFANMCYPLTWGGEGHPKRLRLPGTRREDCGSVARKPSHYVHQSGMYASVVLRPDGMGLKGEDLF